MTGTFQKLTELFERAFPVDDLLYEEAGMLYMYAQP